MASGITTAFWSMTINNYDDNDLALVQNGYPDYMRELVWQLEEGEQGTPHIQAWIKLQRQQRLSFVKKLFPRGHFKPITSDVYIQNVKEYAQKNDDTKVAAAVHSFNDPMRTIETLMRKVIDRILDEYTDVIEREAARVYAERDLVREDYKNAKIFVSATYKQMWKHFGGEMMACVAEMRHTHTHTHTDETISQSVDIPHAGETSEDSSQEGSQGDEYLEESDSQSSEESDYD